MRNIIPACTILSTILAILKKAVYIKRFIFQKVKYKNNSDVLCCGISGITLRLKI